MSPRISSTTFVVNHDKRDSQLKESIDQREDERSKGTVLWPPADETEGARFLGNSGRTERVHEGEEELLVIGRSSG